MKKKVITAIIIAAILVPTFWFGGIPTFIITSIICWFSIYEILTLGKNKDWSIAVYFVTIIGAFLILYWNNILNAITAIKNNTPFSITDFSQIRVNVLVILFFLISILTVEVASHNFYLPDAFYLFTMTVFIASACQGINYIRASLGRSGLGYIIAVTLGCDAFAQLIGSKFGKHKLSPIISPNKTIEGAIGGIILGAALGIIVYAIFPFKIGELTYAQGFIFVVPLALILGIGAVVGDLIFSSVKRQAHQKDFSSLLPGHGGMLDRFDSTLFNSLLFLVFYISIFGGLLA